MGKPSSATAPVANAPAKSNTAIAPVTEAKQSVAPLVEQFDAFEEFAGGGMEKLTAKDVLIPRLSIINALSDQKKTTHVNYIKGCEIGDIVDTATNEIMPRPLEFVPVLFDKVWIEWFPRNTRKGIAQIHTSEAILNQTKPNEKNQPTLANGNLVSETAQIYGINLLSRRPCFIAFTNTQLKKVRRWMTLAQGERLQRRDGSEYIPPLFYRSYTLDTTLESNAEGEWAGWTIERSLALPQLPNFGLIMQQCIEFRDKIAAGIMRGDITNMTDDPGHVVIDGKAEAADPNAKM